ncbi:MAG: erythromycin biosynthesis sensory transduction protein eryC1 [Verrucomicrobia bacterium]|nr:MAG: erythromycin biosynthesis sensory transduction protein eryC1 [Verrucomicrobiota bacterium]
MKVPFLDLSLQHQSIREELLAAWAQTLDAGRFCLGQDVVDFEESFARACGTEAAVGLDNGTSALHLSAVALDLGPEDEIIVPAFTFIATAWTAEYIGAKLVFADVDPETFCLDPKAFEAAITKRTRAVVAVHLFGQPAPMDEIMDVAERHGLDVIEDCAQAHLARYRGRPVGLIGDVGTFSFYPTKNLGGCGEGGAVISRRNEILDAVRILRIHGMAVRYTHDRVGFNARMEGLQAAALSVKLPHLQSWTEGRRRVARRYRDGITHKDITLPSVPEWGESVYHQFTIRHPDRDALRAHLTKAGIGTDIIYPIPLHLQPCFRDLGHEKGAFPISESIADTCLSLPVFPELTENQVDCVIETINRF